MKNRRYSEISESEESDTVTQPKKKLNSKAPKVIEKISSSDSDSSSGTEKEKAPNPDSSVLTPPASPKKTVRASPLSKFVEQNPGLTKADIKEIISEDDDVYYLEIPKTIDPQQILGKRIRNDKRSKLKLNNIKYVIEPKNDNIKPLSILTNHLQVVHPVANLQLQVYRKQKNSDESIESETSTPSLPENLKVRHPLFGAKYENKIILDEAIERKLESTIDHFLKKKKKKRKEKVKEKEQEEPIFTLLESHTGRDRKKKHRDNQEYQNNDQVEEGKKDKKKKNREHGKYESSTELSFTSLDEEKKKKKHKVVALSDNDNVSENKKKKHREKKEFETSQSSFTSFTEENDGNSEEKTKKHKKREEFETSQSSFLSFIEESNHNSEEKTKKHKRRKELETSQSSFPSFAEENNHNSEEKTKKNKKRKEFEISQELINESGVDEPEKKKKHKKKKKREEQFMLENQKAEDKANSLESVHNYFEYDELDKNEAKRNEREKKNKINIINSTIIPGLQLPCFDFNISNIMNKEERISGCGANTLNNHEGSVDEFKSDHDGSTQNKKESFQNSNSNVELAEEAQTSWSKKKKKKSDKSEEDSGVSPKKKRKKDKKESEVTNNLISDILSRVKSEMTPSDEKSKKKRKSDR